MTTTTLNGFTVNQSSRYSTIYSGYNMFSSSTVNGWRSGQYYNNPYNGYASTATTNAGTLTGDYVLIQCPLPVILSSFTITPHPSYLPNMPNSFAIVASNDNTTWVNLGTFAETVSAQKTFAVSTQGKYTYFRFVVMALGSGTYAVVQKMRLDGVTEEPGDLSVGFGLTKTVGVLAVDSSQVQNKLGLVAPLQWTGAGDTLEINQAGITQVGTLLQTNISTTGQLFTDTVGKMTALRLSASSNSFDGVALSLDATWLAGAARNWAIQSLADGSLAFNPSPNPVATLSGLGNLVVNEVLTNNNATIGGTLWANTINSNIGKTTIPTQVFISNAGAVNYNWTALHNSTGGALECNGGSLFHGPMVISGRTSASYTTGGQFRWFSYDNTGLSSVTGGGYSLILGQQGRMLVGAGSMIHCYSDERVKKDITSIDGQRALEIVKTQRAVSFKYKDASEKRFGMIAQECIEKELLRDLVSVAKMGDEDERFVMNTQDTTFILWAAVRELAREVKELRRGRSE